MTPPTLSPEQREQALAKAAEARREGTALDALADGKITLAASWPARMPACTGCWSARCSAPSRASGSHARTRPWPWPVSLTSAVSGTRRPAAQGARAVLRRALPSRRRMTSVPPAARSPLVRLAGHDMATTARHNRRTHPPEGPIMDDMAKHSSA